MSVEIKKDNSKEISEKIEEAVLRGLVTCGLTAEKYAKKLTPVDTGLLRNSITYAISGEEAAIDTYEDNEGKNKGFYSGTAPEESSDKKKSVYIGTNVEYASMVEIGTLRADAQPFLKPAVNDHQSKYRKIIENELKNG